VLELTQNLEMLAEYFACGAETWHDDFDVVVDADLEVGLVVLSLMGNVSGCGHATEAFGWINFSVSFG